MDWRRKEEVKRWLKQFCFPGRENAHANGVALILNRSTAKTLIEWEPVSDRIIRARFQSKHYKLTKLQCNAPTNEAEDEVKDDCYEQLQYEVSRVPQHDLLLIMEDAEDFKLKGFDLAGKVVAELNNAHLVFVGAPVGKHKDIAKHLLDCGLPAHRLTVRSFLQSREDLKRLFWEVDLELMPPRTEGFGLTGLEALSAGLPVLVSKNSGFGEALR